MHAPPLLSALVAGAAYSEACRRDRLPLWPTENHPSTTVPLPLIQYCFRTYGGARGSRLSWRIYPRSTRNSVQRDIARVIGHVILQSVDVLLCFRTYGPEWET